MDRCKGCLKLQTWPQPSHCPICGCSTPVTFEYPEMIWDCPHCGPVIGATYYYNCGKNRDLYEVKVTCQVRDNQMILQVEKLFHVFALDAKRQLDEGTLSESLELAEAWELHKQLDSLKISNEIIPAIEFSHYAECYEEKGMVE